MRSPPPTPAMDSSQTLKSQSRLRSNLLDDQIDTQTLKSPSPRRNPSPLHFPNQELGYIGEENNDLAQFEVTPRRKNRNRGLGAPISPRNGRRGRRRLEKENVREEKVLIQVEDDGRKMKKRKQGRARMDRKESMSLIRSVPCSCLKTGVWFVSRFETWDICSKTVIRAMDGVVLCVIGGIVVEET